MVIVTIALGIGVNLGIFAIIQAIFLNLLGVPDADRVVYYTLGTGRDTTVRLSIQQYEALRTNTAENDILAWQPMMLQLRGPAEDVHLNGALVTGNTSAVLGVRPFLGRFFSEAEDVEGGGKNGWTAVLGYSYWKAHWAADPNVVGKTINLNGASVQIVGVLPREFTGVEPFKRVDILVPRQFETVTDRVRLSTSSPGVVYLHWFVLGRLPTGISIQQVQANLRTIEPRFVQATLPGGLAMAMFPTTAPRFAAGRASRTNGRNAFSYRSQSSFNAARACGCGSSILLLQPGSALHRPRAARGSCDRHSPCAGSAARRPGAPGRG
jgi:putative ABC transport system permease protein